jgi:hypothetical protein
LWPYPFTPGRNSELGSPITRGAPSRPATGPPLRRILNLSSCPDPATCAPHCRLHRKSSPASAPKVTSHIPSVLVQRKVALVDLPFQDAHARGEPRSSFPIYSSPSPCYLIWKRLPESSHN